MCVHDPPEVAYATFKALAYKNGTILNCECKRGFRRVKKSVYMVCLEKSWSNKCQCTRNLRTKVQVLGTRVTLGLRSSLETLIMPSQTCLQNYCPLPGHCGEPPPWEHEDTKRIYHFMVGQRVHYECIQGYKALQRGPAVSICKMICGKTRWTQPQLTCVDEREHHQFPGMLC
ncbi:Interleukin-2 receptor subunit alpha [Lemmus lemmus]